MIILPLLSPIFQHYSKSMQSSRKFPHADILGTDVRTNIGHYFDVTYCLFVFLFVSCLSHISLQTKCPQTAGIRCFGFFYLLKIISLSMEVCRLSITIQNSLLASGPIYQEAYLTEKTRESTPMTAKGKEREKKDRLGDNNYDKQCSY